MLFLEFLNQEDGPFFSNRTTPNLYGFLYHMVKSLIPILFPTKYIQEPDGRKEENMGVYELEKRSVYNRYGNSVSVVSILCT